MGKRNGVFNSSLDDLVGNNYDHTSNFGSKDETAANLDRLLTVQEVCELLKVSKTYIYWLTHQKKIPYIKMYGHLRFRQSDIDAWLRSQEVHIVNT